MSTGKPPTLSRTCKEQCILNNHLKENQAQIINVAVDCRDRKSTIRKAMTTSLISKNIHRESKFQFHLFVKLSPGKLTEMSLHKILVSQIHQNMGQVDKLYWKWHNYKMLCLTELHQMTICRKLSPMHLKLHSFLSNFIEQDLPLKWTLRDLDIFTYPATIFFDTLQSNLNSIK